jgi:hypothetical protein
LFISGDDPEFDTPRQVFDKRFNCIESPSMWHYFREVSYQQLDIISYHFPEAPLEYNLSYRDENPRAYYEPFHAVNNPIGYDTNVGLGDANNQRGRTFRQHTLLVNAINAVSHQVPTDLIIDVDGDGLVDNVSFIVYGPQGQWNNLLSYARISLYR